MMDNNIINILQYIVKCMCIIRLYRVKPDLCTRIIVILESAATAAVACTQLFFMCEVRLPPPPKSVH